MRKYLAVLLSAILTLWPATPVVADSLSITNWSNGDSLNSSQLNARHTSIVNWSITIADDNIKAAAAIKGSKLDLTDGTGRITNAGGTLTSDYNIINSSATWNSAGLAFTGWKLNVTNTTSASASRLFDIQVGGTTIASLSRVGQFHLAPQDVASGSVGVTRGAWFNVASATYTENRLAASGTSPNWVAYAFQRPALAGANTGLTTTHAATVFIASAPVAGNNMTITNRYALWVDQGDVRLGGNVFASGSLTVDGNLVVKGTGAATVASQVNFFNLATCPTGWTEYTALRGRIPVGLPSGGNLANNNDADSFTDKQSYAAAVGQTGVNYNTFVAPGSGKTGPPTHQLLACVKD